jgi:hypothetical protein
MAVELDIEVVTNVELKEATEVDEEGQVIVHCKYVNDTGDFAGVRIWKSTFLLDENSEHESELLHAEGVTYYPHWTAVAPNKTHRFTLIFSRLPKSCTHFHFYERIPQPGGFMVANIKRNNSDVYTIEI